MSQWATPLPGHLSVAVVLCQENPFCLLLWLFQALTHSVSTQSKSCLFLKGHCHPKSWKGGRLVTSKSGNFVPPSVVIASVGLGEAEALQKHLLLFCYSVAILPSHLYRGNVMYQLAFSTGKSGNRHSSSGVINISFTLLLHKLGIGIMVEEQRLELQF